jgi:hypothetical protein
MVQKDLAKPGISRLFQYRIELRVRAALRAIQRDGLPGVAQPEAVKTFGTESWKSTGPLRRLFDTVSADEYLVVARHALVTMLDGGGRRPEARVVADDAALAGLSGFVAPLRQAELERILDETTAVTKELQLEIRTGAKLRRRNRGRGAEAVVPPEVGAVADEVDHAAAACLAVPEVAQSSSSVVVAAEVVRQASRLSAQSGASQEEVWDSDKSASERDSRSEGTDDSFDSDSAVSTVSDGYSAGVGLDAGGDLEMSEYAPSAACSSGDEGSGPAWLLLRAQDGTCQAGAQQSG